MEEIKISWKQTWEIHPLKQEYEEWSQIAAHQFHLKTNTAFPHGNLSSPEPLLRLISYYPSSDKNHFFRQHMPRDHSIQARIHNTERPRFFILSTISTNFRFFQEISSWLCIKMLQNTEEYIEKRKNPKVGFFG